MFRYFSCATIALGNGTACRETETFLSELIQRKYFDPVDVQYTIVPETGASIYSCSPEVKVEFPSLDPNVISASKYHDQVLKTKYREILTAGIFKFPSPVVCKIR